MRHTMIKIIIFSAVYASLPAFAHTQTHLQQKKNDGKTVSQIKNVNGKVLYTCPMHHDYFSNKPGKCPKCKMTLVKVEQKSRPAGSRKVKKDTPESR